LRTRSPKRGRVFKYEVREVAKLYGERAGLSKPELAQLKDELLGVFFRNG